MTCVLWVNWVQNNRAAQRAANSTELATAYGSQASQPVRQLQFTKLESTERAKTCVVADNIS